MPQDRRGGRGEVWGALAGRAGRGARGGPCTRGAGRRRGLSHSDRPPLPRALAPQAAWGGLAVPQDRRGGGVLRGPVVPQGRRGGGAVWRWGNSPAGLLPRPGVSAPRWRGGGGSPDVPRSLRGGRVRGDLTEQRLGWKSREVARRGGGPFPGFPVCVACWGLPTDWRHPGFWHPLAPRGIPRGREGVVLGRARSQFPSPAWVLRRAHA